MKLVHVAVGNTKPYKEILKKLGFMWMPGEVIWVQFLNHDDDVPNQETRQTLADFDGVACIVSLADPFIRTCVDPLYTDRDKIVANYDWTSELDENEKAELARVRYYRAGSKIEEKQPTDSHPWEGRRAELNKYASNSVLKEVNRNREEPITYLYRNITINKVEAETAKAVRIRFEFYGGIGRNCHVCGAALDTEISRACGIGPTCAKKMGLPRPNANNASIILAQIEEIAGSFGEIGPVWVPKSCIEILE